MKRLNFFACLMVALTGLSPMVKAQIIHSGDDGYFCTSKGYLAFDYNQTEIQGRVVKNVHSLRIIRFGPGHHIYFAGEVSLPREFWTTLIDCGAERVEIVGRLFKCDVRIGPPVIDIQSADCRDNTGGKPLTVKSPNLKIYTIEDPLPTTLEATVDTDDVYQLRRHHTQESVPGRGVNWKTEVEVVELDRKGTVLDRLVIYEYVYLEAAD